jgi:acetolactate synthase I/II/III large subunit
MNRAQFFLSILEGIGLKDGFSLVGGMAMHLNYAAHRSNIRITYCNHEQAVVSAAEGYVKADQYLRPALAIVTSGPGVTNAITALASAYYDSVPLILLSGQVKSADLNVYGVRSFGAQEVPHTALLSQVTKLSFSYDPFLISNAQLAKNLSVAMEGRKGPIHIDIPLDIQSQEVKSDLDVDEVVSKYFAALAARRSSGDGLPTDLLHAIEHARRPLLVLGNGLRIASVPYHSVRALVEQLGTPCLLTWASMDLLDHDHHQAFGCAGGLAGVHSNRILQAADLIIFLGVRLDLLTTGFRPSDYGRNARRFVIEIDEAEAAKNSRLPNTTVLRTDLSDLVAALYTRGVQCKNQDVGWLVQCQAWRAENDYREAAEFATRKLNCFHVARVLSASRLTRYVVPTASGFAIEGFARFYKAMCGSRYDWAGHVLGSMGLAIGSAIGAARRLGALVTCVDGDGGFLLNMQELYTIKANSDLAIAFIVLNNQGYVSIQNSQRRSFGEEFGASKSSGLAEIDFHQVARLASLKYVRCEDLDSFEMAVADLQQNSRVLIDVMLDDDGYRGPSISTKFDEQGRPYSTALEDVSWR